MMSFAGRYAKDILSLSPNCLPTFWNPSTDGDWHGVVWTSGRQARINLDRGLGAKIKALFCQARDVATPALPEDLYQGTTLVGPKQTHL